MKISSQGTSQDPEYGYISQRIRERREEMETVEKEDMTVAAYVNTGRAARLEEKTKSPCHSG